MIPEEIEGDVVAHRPVAIAIGMHRFGAQMRWHAGSVTAATFEISGGHTTF
jgi:hypothetical protein